MQVDQVTKRTYRVRVARRMHLDLPLGGDLPAETWRFPVWSRFTFPRPEQDGVRGIKERRPKNT